MGIPEFLDSGRKNCTVESGRSTLDDEFWTLEGGL